MKLTTLSLTFLSLAVAAMLYLPDKAMGQWSLLDNFESATIGPLGSQGGWNTSPSTQPDTDYRVEVKSSDGTNKSLQVEGANLGPPVDHITNAFLPLGSGIANGTTGTLFFRMANDIAGNLVVGSSDVASPSAWGDYEGYIAMAGASIQVRNGGGFSALETYNDDEWYNFWLVLDNDADTTTVYASQGGAAAALLGSGGFRNGTSDPLVTLLVRAGEAIGIPGNLDDIYLDTSGSNLTFPDGVGVPEPASIAMLTMLGLFSCSRVVRRRI